MADEPHLSEDERGFDPDAVRGIIESVFEDKIYPELDGL